jgi:hypothetical protein
MRERGGEGEGERERIARFIKLIIIICDTWIMI